MFVGFVCVVLCPSFVTLVCILPACVISVVCTCVCNCMLCGSACEFLYELCVCVKSVYCMFMLSMFGLCHF